MKSSIFNRGISILLCLLTVISIMFVPLTASARYADDFDGTYDDLNCAEDDCDCLEPENNRFAIVSPSNVNNTHNTIVLTGTYQEVQNYFKENGQTDGLPVIPPTKLKAEKFMRYTSYNDNDVIATVNGREVTAYQVAVNAIMSGSSAEYMPVCIAFTKALGNGEYLDSLRTGNLTPMMYVNGPVARQLGIDNTQGMTTEECNIAIARFMELALINLAGIERTNAFGNVQPLVFSENEQVCLNIGWEPHHVEEGYALNDSTITATSFAMWGNNVTPATDLPEEIMKIIAWDITEKNLGGLGSASSKDNADTKRLIFITESVATALSTKYKTKDALENALVENARRPLWMRAYAYYYANTGGALSKSFSDVYNELKGNTLEDAKLTASPAWMNGITYANIDTVATMKKGNTDIIITGDSSRNKTQVMPGGIAVTEKVELPSVWNNLMTSMSYQSLDTYYISKVDNSVKVPTGNAIPSELQVTKETTYRIVASSNYANGTGKIYYDSSISTLYYWDGSATQSMVLDKNNYADFIAFVEALGVNSTFKLDSDNKVIEVIVRFSSNKSLPDKNVVEFTKDSFGTLTPIIAANAKSGSNGNASLDGAVITMNDTITTFTADLGGDIVMGASTDANFVKISGNTVTVNPTVSVGATAVIGTADGSGTYRAMTLVNGGDGTYKITYNTTNTLTLATSAYYLKGTFNNWGETDAFVKTDNNDILTVIKDIPAGTYKFKVYNAGTDAWYGDATTITDVANRWNLSSDSECTFEATGGTYEFKYEISTSKLSVYYAQKDVATPATKTVYVGVGDHIKDFVPTLYYWNDSINLTGDAALTDTGETVQYSVGSTYWNNAKQNFKVYKTEIPATATGMKTFRQSNNDRWAVEDITYEEDKILLLFEWEGTYHNTTVTAVWEEIFAKKYMVSYFKTEGSGTMTGSAVAENGSFTLGENEFMAPEGYKFKAWAIGSVNGEQKQPGEKITITGDTNLYAVWEKIEYSITVTDGTASLGGETPNTKATVGTTVTLTAGEAPSGKMFDKWIVNGVIVADANSAVTTFTMPAGDVTAQATYKDIPVVTYTVTFDANGGTGTMNSATNVAGDYVLPRCDFMAPEGKQFKGWSVNGAEKAVGEVINVTADTVITAVWEKIEYSIIITDGIASMDGATLITKATMGTIVTLTADEAPLGKMFDKWIVDGVTVADAESTVTTFIMPAGNVTLQAVYKDIPVEHICNVKLIPKVEPTCTNSGKKAYYKCDGCGKVFEDALGSSEITDLKAWGIIQPAHTYGNDNICDVCGYNKGGTIKPTLNPTQQQAADKLGLTDKSAKDIISFIEKNKIPLDTIYITEKSIIKQKSEDIKGAVFKNLSMRATKTTKNKITVKWNKVKGADGYIVYGNKCGAKNKFKKIATLNEKKTSYTQSKCKKGTFYKYIVVAYKTVDGKKVTIAVSKTVHVTTTGGKYGNAKAVKVNKTKVSLKEKKSFEIKASEVKKDKKLAKHRGLAYESSNTTIATVNKKGKITAKKKGSCYIYVYAQNGTYKRIKVTVK